MEDKQVYELEMPDFNKYEMVYNRATNEAEFDGLRMILGYERFLDFILTAQVLGINVKRIK